MKPTTKEERDEWKSSGIDDYVNWQGALRRLIADVDRLEGQQIWTDWAVSITAAARLKKELQDLRERYLMNCASCGAIRAMHPMHWKDCNGFKESESFRD